MAFLPFLNGEGTHKALKQADKKETFQSNSEAKHIPVCTPFCVEK